MQTFEPGQSEQPIGVVRTPDHDRRVIVVPGAPVKQRRESSKSKLGGIRKKLVFDNVSVLFVCRCLT
jgi:hypothetical protein